MSGTKSDKSYKSSQQIKGNKKSMLEINLLSSESKDARKFCKIRPHPRPPYSCSLGFTIGSAVKNLPAMQESQSREFNPLVGIIPWRRAWQSGILSGQISYTGSGGLQSMEATQDMHTHGCSLLGVRKDLCFSGSFNTIKIDF